MEGAENQQQNGETNRVRISYEEYQRLSMMIVAVMKEFEREGRENVQQKDILDKITRRIEID